MNCIKCDNIIPPDSSFCGKCGAKVENEIKLKVVSQDVTPKFPKSLFIGRIGRLNYFLGRLFSTLPIIFTGVIWYILSSENLDQDPSALVLIIFMLASFCLFALWAGLLIRRCHDIGISGWFSLLAFIPYLGFIPGLYFLFKRGEEKSNKYGGPLSGDRKFLADVFNY